MWKLKVPSNYENHLKPSAINKKNWTMSKAKLPVGKVKSSPTSNNSGVKFFKAFAPSIRRRRQCDKEKLEIYNFDSGNNEGFNVWDAIPASPITPPAAFLPPDYNYRRSGKKNPWTKFHLHLRHPMQMVLDLKNFTIVILLLSEVLSSEKKGRKKINSRFPYTAQHHEKSLSYIVYFTLWFFLLTRELSNSTTAGSKHWLFTFQLGLTVREMLERKKEEVELITVNVWCLRLKAIKTDEKSLKAF